MKTQKHFKQVMMTAALVLAVGNLTSCKDQDFDWDAAHANTAQKKFTNAFIEAFGKPEAGHQWGFDMPWNKENDTRSVDVYQSNDPNAPLTIIKPEGDGAGPTEWAYIEKYGTVPYITDQEHHDVYQWFSTHKVSWDNTTTKIGKPTITDGKCTDLEGYTYKIEKKNGSTYTDITSSYKSETVFDGRVTKSKAGEENQVFEGKISVGNGGCDGLLAKIVYSEDSSSAQSTRNASGGAIAYWDNTEMDNNKLKDAYKYTNLYAGMVVNFEFAWIQHVASTKYDSNKADTTWTSKTWDELAFSGDYFEYSSDKMDYLHIYPAAGGQGHAENYNKGNGPGYNWSNDTNNIPKTQNMGVMALGANLNQLKYYNSADSHWHDKWIIVYLEGDGYAGWYLGFDLEGSKEQDGNAQFSANGYCNDWIIKLTSVNPYVEEYPTNCRIMCEDLGGFNNEVTIGEESHISDIDYNDVVIDVTSNDNKVVNITLQAAGGTLPLTVWYDGYPLFETHEFFSEYVVRSDYELCSSDCSSQSKSADTPTSNTNYKTMYNTEGGSNATTTDGVDSRTVTLLCNTSKHCTDNGRKAVRFSGDFDLSKLEIKVWRHSAESYIEQETSFSYSPAEWLTITNYDGEAPLKICVPDTVQWLKERDAVDLGYPRFKTWVGDHSQYFWKASDVNTNYLCTKRKPSKPSVCTCTETGGSGSTGGGSTGGGSGNNEQVTPSYSNAITGGNPTSGGKTAIKLTSKAAWAEYSLSTDLPITGYTKIEVDVINVSGDFKIKVCGGSETDVNNSTNAEYIGVSNTNAQQTIQINNLVTTCSNKGWTNLSRIGVMADGNNTSGSITIKEVRFYKDDSEYVIQTLGGSSYTYNFDTEDYTSE